MANTVGVRELRQNLSKYLARVKEGETLDVTERGQTVARLSPSGGSTDPYARLAATLGVKPPTGDIDAAFIARFAPAGDVTDADVDQTIAELRRDRF